MATAALANWKKTTVPWFDQPIVLEGIQHNFTVLDLANLFQCWLDGGSTGLFTILRKEAILPEGTTLADFHHENGKYGIELMASYTVYPFIEGGVVPLQMENVSPSTDKPFLVFNFNLEAMRIGLIQLQKNHPKIYGMIVEGQYDANDAAALFETIIYGKIVFC